MHVRLDEMESYVRGTLPVTEVDEINSHVASCPACSEKLGETQSFRAQLSSLSQCQAAHPSPAERRKSRRVPTNEPARIKVLHPTVSAPQQARILDVSKDGLKIEMTEPVEPGTTVEVLLKRFIAIAEVRYCVRTGEMYHTGVSIQDVFPKTPC